MSSELSHEDDNKILILEEMDEEDEDVVLEGSELHRALQDAGCIDFVPIPIKRRQRTEESRSNSKLFETMSSFFRGYINPMSCDKATMSYLSGKQIATILQADTLLDDHVEFVENLLNKNPQTFWSKLREWSTLVASASILGISYLIQERNKSLVMLIASSVATIAIHNKCKDFNDISNLKNLVSLQNRLRHLYKKALRIVSKGFQTRTKFQHPGAFSNLEIDHLKYVQPLTETLLKSLSTISRIYYKASLMIGNILPRKDLDYLSMRLDDQEFNADGEITYENFKSLYYIYIMVVSDALQLLAVAYDSNTWIETGGKIPYSQLARIISSLYRLSKTHERQLLRIVESYENCKPRIIQRSFRGPKASKWRDLYLNLDLLSRKVATVYDAIGSILEDIDKHENDDESANGNLILDLTPRINDIYKQIDSARNFAEFGDLLMVMLKRSNGKREENLCIEQSIILPTVANDLSIVRDSDPRIIDEVFEEYITEEYLKPLYDDSCDETGLESAKFDRLLAKNFMNELKEALVDKCKSMSEREAKALLRKRREMNGDNSEKFENGEPSIFIPRPPPMPVVYFPETEPYIVSDKREKREFRSPVPLPRMSGKSGKIDFSVSSSRPPPPPPLPQSMRPELSEENSRFSIDLPMMNAIRKIPAFVTFEEEFIGSGENSEEELESNSDNDEDLKPPS